MSILPYAIFAGYFYQTNSGGFDNICDFAETLEKAIHIYETILYTKNHKITKYDWVHIVELRTKSIVIDSRKTHKIISKSKL
jgi:hypothetical protein|uniref:Uncharacterized protein n=1 Tax=viral metagenome TaxID=1070528 RepID=A0A6C0LPG4_9ZZZZ